MTADFSADHLFLGVIDAAIGLGRGNQCPQDRMAVFLGLRAGQQVHGPWRFLRRRGLTALPGLVRLERHHAQGRQRGIIGAASGTTLRCTAHRRTAAKQTTEQTTQPCATAASTGTGTPAQQTAEQSTQVAEPALGRCATATLSRHRALAGAQ
ncbi:hypothetical protein D3C71_1213870 [compost metagenome]